MIINLLTSAIRLHARVWLAHAFDAMPVVYLYILQEYKQNETIGSIPCTWPIAAIILLQKGVHSYKCF